MTDTTAGWLLSEPGTAAAAAAASVVLVLLLAVITVRVRRDRFRGAGGYSSRHAAATAQRAARADPLCGDPGPDGSDRPGCEITPPVYTPGKAGVPGQARFVCPWCGAASSDPCDILHGYCGRCHAFTGGQLPAPGEAR